MTDQVGGAVSEAEAAAPEDAHFQQRRH